MPLSQAKQGGVIARGVGNSSRVAHLELPFGVARDQPVAQTAEVRFPQKHHSVFTIFDGIWAADTQRLVEGATVRVPRGVVECFGRKRD